MFDSVASIIIIGMGLWYLHKTNGLSISFNVHHHHHLLSAGGQEKEPEPQPIRMPADLIKSIEQESAEWYREELYDRARSLFLKSGDWEVVRACLHLDSGE